MRIGSRSSPLALAQVNEVISLLGRTLPHEHITFETRGDKDKKTPLTDQPADGFFTDSLDASLLKNEIDVAVHSAKDLPKIFPQGLAIFALTPVLDDTDAWVSDIPWNDLPQASRVGTSSILRQSQISKIRPDLRIINIRGTIQERLGLLDAKKVDGIIVASCALKRLNLADRIKYVFPWAGTALQGQLAVVGRSSDLKMMEIFKSIDVRRKYGKVTLVGAGPGDPDLITIKAIKALEKADCVLYDYLVNKNILSHAPRAVHIYAGKRKGDHALSQDELSNMLRIQAMQGKNVVRLKGGDPLVFGRGADEILYLNSYHISVEIVPGISSATGIPSSLGLPLTARGFSSSVSFVSGHEEDEDKTGERPVRIPSTDTIVFLMGLTKLKGIVSALRDAGWKSDTPVLIASQGTRIDEQIVLGNLGNIEASAAQVKLKPPALIVVGKTVNLYQPRNQKTYLHCGTHPDLYAHLGRIIPWPMIEIKPVIMNSSEHEQLKTDFVKSDMIVLTSPAAVRCFMDTILKDSSILELQKKVFAVIGHASSEVLHTFGITAQVVSKEETAQGLLKTLLELMSVQGMKILFPRSSLPNPFLKDALRQQGAEVYEWTVYFNVKPEWRSLPDQLIHGIVFTSPSTVKNFLADYKAIPPQLEILAKGPVTQTALTEAGYTSRIIR